MVERWPATFFSPSFYWILTTLSALNLRGASSISSRAGTFPLTSKGRTGGFGRTGISLSALELTIRLHAAPAIGQLLATPLVALDAVPRVVFIVAGAVVIVGGYIVSGGSDRTRQMRRCPEGSIDLDLPGRDNPCIEIAD
jgi:hypothetical protein